MMNLTTDQFRELLAKYLQQIGQAHAVTSINAEVVDDEIVTVSVDTLGVGIDLDGATRLRAYYIKCHPSSRYPEQHDEDEDVTLCETLSPVEALAAIGAHLAREAAEQVWMDRLPADLPNWWEA